MNNFINWVNRNILYLFLIFLLLINILPFIAPILANLEQYAIARGIYNLYSLFCHQQHWKSIHIHDYQVAWCTRDVFIWGSMLISLILVITRNIKPLSFIYLIIYSIPMLIDGGLQTISVLFGYGNSDALYVSNNFSRMFTGTLFGSALGLYLFPIMKQIANENKSDNSLYPIKRLLIGRTNHWRIVCSILVSMFLIYIVLVQVWQITSTEYMPSNFLDTETKLPEDNRDWFLRRQKGI